MDSKKDDKEERSRPGKPNEEAEQETDAENTAALGQGHQDAVPKRQKHSRKKSRRHRSHHASSRSLLNDDNDDGRKRSHRSSKSAPKQDSDYNDDRKRSSRHRHRSKSAPKDDDDDKKQASVNSSVSSDQAPRERTRSMKMSERKDGEQLSQMASRSRPSLVETPPATVPPSTATSASAPTRPPATVSSILVTSASAPLRPMPLSKEDDMDMDTIESKHDKGDRLKRSRRDQKSSSSRSKKSLSTGSDEHIAEKLSGSRLQSTPSSFADGYFARVQTDYEQASERSFSSHSNRHDIDSLLSAADEESNISIDDNNSYTSRTLEEIAGSVNVAERLSLAPSTDSEQDVEAITEQTTMQVQDVAGSVGANDEDPHLDAPPGVEQDPANQQDIEADGETRTQTQEDAFSAYLALTPEEIRQQLMDNAVDAIRAELHPSERRRIKREKQRKRRMYIAVATSIVIAAALAVSLGLTLSGRDEDAPTPAPVTITTQAPTSVRFGEVVGLVETISDTSSLLDPSSPQHQAARWMAEEDELYGDLATVEPDQFRQRYVMALFYFATGGPTWKETSFFLKPDVHECKWWDTAIPNTQAWSKTVGVMCSLEYLVEGLEINQNNLTGTLPVELGSLSSLAALVVLGNDIGGTLPTSIFSLSNLQILYLLSNGFSGTIPSEVGQATSLRFLFLDANSFTGVIPSELGDLPSLEQLDLGGNFLTGVMPTTLFRLSLITLIELADNALTGTLSPTLWSSWPNLRVFGVKDNSLSGEIPNNLESVPQLEELVLQQNNFSGPFPSSVVKLTNVKWLSVDGNDFTGSLPNDWSTLSSTLDTLQVSENRLSGTLPDSLGSLTKLIYLNLFDNGFVGTIPASLGNLSELLLLQFGTDGLTGTVPSSFVQLSSLQQLTLHESKLTGDLTFLCDGTEMRFPFMTGFAADCFGANPEVICPCCNRCCNMHDTCYDRSENDWVEVVP